jgi:hypothetical protein
MKAEQVIELIQSLEPTEIERFFVLIREYESEVRRRQASVSSASGEDFEAVVGQILTENEVLLQKLAEFEAKERTQK